MEQHGIPYHEKTLGQLFCDRSSKDIVDLLQAECDAAHVEIRVRTPVKVEQLGPPHRVHTAEESLQCESLVIATGGYSIPTMGATGFAFDFARQLGLAVQPTRAALVPFTLAPTQLEELGDLSGVSLDTTVSAAGTTFREHLLFTHRGLSGPAVLQASSYWSPGESVEINLFPDLDIAETIRSARAQRPKIELRTFLRELLTRRVAQRWCEHWLPDKPLGQLTEADVDTITGACQPWTIRPAGTEGWRTAEVTLGGLTRRAVVEDTRVQRPRSAALHRRGGRRDRPPWRPQLPMGLGLRTGRRRSGLKAQPTSQGGRGGASGVSSSPAMRARRAFSSAMAAWISASTASTSAFSSGSS